MMDKKATFAVLFLAALFLGVGLGVLTAEIHMAFVTQPVFLMSDLQVMYSALYIAIFVVSGAILSGE